MSLQWPDWIVIGVYLCAMLAIGLWAMRQIHDPGGFLLGRRKMGRLMMIAAQFGAGTSANDPVVVASQCYRSGVSGIWVSLSYLFITPIFWVMPPAYRRLRMVTMVDFIRMRYGREMEIFYNVLQTIVAMLGIGAGIKAAGLTIYVMSGGGISEVVAQLIITALILGYALPGGVVAAFATDIVQSVLIVLLSFILLPFAANELGGFSVVYEKVPEGMFRIFSEGDITPTWVFWFVAGSIFAIMSESRQAAHGAARNEIAARCGALGMLMKRVCAVGWMMAGIFAIAIYGSGLEHADEAFPRLCQDVLPWGLRGLMLASILAAVMSTADAGMVFGTSILLNNIYREFFVPKASARHYLRIARIGGAIMVIVGWLMAMQVQNLVSFIIKAGSISTVVGLPIGCAIFWRRGTRLGAIAGVLVMAPLFFYGTQYQTMPEAIQLAWLSQYAGESGNLPLTVWTPSTCCRDCWRLCRSRWSPGSMTRKASARFMPASIRRSARKNGFASRASRWTCSKGSTDMPSRSISGTTTFRSVCCWLIS